MAAISKVHFKLGKITDAFVSLSPEAPLKLKARRTLAED